MLWVAAAWALGDISVLTIDSPPTKRWTICIDPGHPSEVGRGTRGKRLTEIKVAWEVAVRLKKDLEARNVVVVMTKSSENQFVRNRKRAEVANRAHADLMVRLHCDASNGTGYTTYFPDRQGSSEGMHGPSMEILKRTAPIAQRFHEKLIQELNGVLVDNGLKGDEATAVGRNQGAFTGSVFSKVPVVLIEMVVLTNRRDEAFVSNPKGLQKLADSLANASLAALGG